MAEFVELGRLTFFGNFCRVQTGKKIKIKGKNVVTFKAGKTLKNKI